MLAQRKNDRRAGELDVAQPIRRRGRGAGRVALDAEEKLRVDQDALEGAPDTRAEVSLRPSLPIEGAQNLQIFVGHRPVERPPRQRLENPRRAGLFISRARRLAYEDAPPAGGVRRRFAGGLRPVGRAFDLEAREGHPLDVAPPRRERPQRQAGRGHPFGGHRPPREGDRHRRVPRGPGSARRARHPARQPAASPPARPPASGRPAAARCAPRPPGRLSPGARCDPDSAAARCAARSHRRGKSGAAPRRPPRDPNGRSSLIRPSCNSSGDIGYRTTSPSIDGSPTARRLTVRAADM